MDGKKELAELRKHLTQDIIDDKRDTSTDFWWQPSCVARLVELERKDAVDPISIVDCCNRLATACHCSAEKRTEVWRNWFQSVNPESLLPGELEFRAGLPPEALRNAWPRWIHRYREAGVDDVPLTFSGQTYRFDWWSAEMPDRRIDSCLAWSSILFRPEGKSWAEVEAMAAPSSIPNLPGRGR